MPCNEYGVTSWRERRRRLVTRPTCPAWSGGVSRQMPGKGVTSMVPRGHWLGLAFPVLLIALACSAACAAEQVSLVDQHWRIVEEGGQPQVELGVLVVNESESPLQYEVRFVVERTERAPQTQPTSQPSEAGTQPAEPVWSAVQVKSVRGGPLAPGTPEAVTTVIPYELLLPGKAYRFRAELLDVSIGMVLAWETITRLENRALAAVGEAGPARGSARASSLSGSGKMVGDHETHRVGNEWIEHGRGTITLTGLGWRMVLTYTYDAHGASAATRVASGTAEGTFSPMSGETLPVRVTYGTAQITQPGRRSQWGQAIRRVDAQATGTFSGTVAGKPWSGVLSLTQGDVMLDLRSDQGDHRFLVQFTASG